MEAINGSIIDVNCERVVNQQRLDKLAGEGTLL